MMIGQNSKASGFYGSYQTSSDSDMGNAGTKAREIKGKPKTGKRINQQKIETAGRTGILSLKESKLKSIPDPVFSVLNLKVRHVKLLLTTVTDTLMGAL